MIAQVKWSLASPCWEDANSSWICLAILLVVGPLAKGVPLEDDTPKREITQGRTK